MNISHRLFFLLTTSTLLLICVSSALGQEWEEGKYVALKKGIIPKYIMVEIQGDSAICEVFTKWQGSWLPMVGSWENYEPERLSRNEIGGYSNGAIVLFKKKETLKGRILKSFAGKSRFKLRPIPSFPPEFLEIKRRAVEFTLRRETQD